MRTLGRRAVKDKICMGMTCLVIIALIGVLVYAIFFDDGDNTLIPDSLRWTGDGALDDLDI